MTGWGGFWLAMALLCLGFCTQQDIGHGHDNLVGAAIRRLERQ